MSGDELKYIDEFLKAVGSSPILAIAAYGFDTFHAAHCGFITGRNQLEERTKQYEVMVEEYAKAKGEASQLQGRLDDVIAECELGLRQTHSWHPDPEGKMTDCERAVGRVAVVWMKSILKLAKGEK